MIRATLVTEGTSDRALLPILRWLLEQLTDSPPEVTWADLRGLSPRPGSLADKLRFAVALYPCDLLFIHRDRDRATREARREEMVQALAAAHKETEDPAITWVPVIPMQMQEAWLLHDERALRRAAGRPSGREPLGLPRLRGVEDLADPKAVLHAALRRASGTKGRRARNFKPARAVHQLAGLIEDWASLRQLDAFRCLEEDTRRALQQLGAPHS